jgi:formate hydrogenlyase transcriptional activator
MGDGGRCIRRSAVLAAGPGRKGVPSQPGAGSAVESPGFDRLVADLSTTLVECPTDAIAGHVGAAVDRMARCLDLDHGWLAHGVPQGGPVRVTLGWTRAGCPPLTPFEPEVSLPWITARLGDGTPVSLASPDELLPEAASDRAFLERAGIRSLVGLPLVVGGTPVGWLAFGTVRGRQPWSAPVMEGLGRMAAAVGSALAREEALRRATEFDQVAGGLAASLIHVPVDTIDSQIVQTLGTAAELLEADRASVIQRFPGERRMTRTHLWVRTGTPGPPLSDPQDAFPWILARLFEARELVVLTRVDELPPEAARDRASLTRYSVMSCALAPMVVQDRVVGIISFATVTRERRWSPDLMARLRLVGEIIAGALARRDAEVALRSALVENERLRERLEAENVYLKAELGEVRDFGEIVGRSAALREVLEQVRQVADTDASVLLLGETGTGKELLARAIHSHGRRRDQPFIAVNCAALPATLIESELFGHEKGAFTGAVNAKPGRFELADRGTLLLDEIGDLDLALQTKLLRVLESGEIQRLGATVTRKVDVRIIAATNRELRRDMREGRFRSDLFYRLSVFPIQVPPLRDRREDIPLLVWHFIQSRNRALDRTITKIPRPAMAALQAYQWPGNVRELQNVIERALILSRGSVLRIEDAVGPGADPRDEAGRRSSAESLQDVERAHILAILERCRWTIEGRGQAAERLGLNPSTLRNRLRKLGITRPAR